MAPDCRLVKVRQKSLPGNPGRDSPTTFQKSDITQEGALDKHLTNNDGISQDLSNSTTMEKTMEQAKNIKLLILDVDGVMSDGAIFIDENGLQHRRFDIKDGMGTVILPMMGIEVAIITSRKSGAVRFRAKELRVKRYYEGIKKKTEAYEEIKADMGIEDSEVCYMGDDLVDLSMMKRVGLPVSVADGVAEVKEAAAYITEAKGGHGAVREVAEMILKAQGKWEKILEKVGG